MKKRKFVCLLAAMSLFGSMLTGCGGNGGKETVASPEASTEASPSASADASGFVGLEDRTPVTLKIFMKDITEDIEFTDPVAEKIKELTGVTLEIEHAVGGDEQAIPLMIASGDYPDMIFAKGDTGLLVDAGALIPLNDFIEEKGTNTKALYGDMIQRLKYSEADPNIYTMGTYGVHTAAWKTDGVMQIQHAILKDQGYPEIKTIAQYEEAIKAYKDKYPQINGQDTIGLTLMGSDWRWLITVGNVASAASGIPDDGEWAIDDNAQTAVYKYLAPGVKDYMKWLNHMNDIGLLDPESFTQQEDVYFAKLASGRVLGTATPEWGTGESKKALVAAGMEERTTAPLAVTVSEEFTPAVTKDYGFSGGHGIGICASSENQEKAFEFLDWMCSEEAQILINWGLEGENYTYDANGKRQLTPEMAAARISDKDFTKKTGITKYVYPFPQQGNGGIDSTGNRFTLDNKETIIEQMTATEKETLKAYGKELWTDFFPTPEELGVSKHGQAWQFNIPSDGNLQVFNQKSQDYIQQAVTQAILGKPADFDAAWDTILAKLDEIGVEEANAEMTKLTQEKIRFWGN
ncbi:ABC transporter substrate-binding protein [Cellulosilyticum lentocellum]|uniref:Extracellular solute-binding protein family 1 n=1 Tax=Cellulosilyticum lentocellum (strain ATCC 49066 / DSM 5427 / NCIMB 11756 / RHM5) TaxID=642492 RepID=F2JRD5_CELLD|nr:ABC transporter substrate-binding protein [Cellulosilyticum lentocellum]ADZ82744.1 extracellular solute-binding protein family 1 [Cellulosilyticum lentocellum DSM 5427]